MNAPLAYAETPQAATAIIAEDEPLLAQILQQELTALWPSLNIVAVARNGREALARIAELQPDIAFLDIKMPAMTGLEVAEALAEDWDEATGPPPLLVFVTAYDEFAVDAFERAAIDYLLKPVQPIRIARCLARVRQRLEERRGLSRPRTATADAALHELVGQLQSVLAVSAATGLRAPPRLGASPSGHPTPSDPSAGTGATRQPASLEVPRGGALPPRPAGAPLRVIRAAVGDSVRVVPVADIIYLQATDKYVTVVTRDAELLIRESLRELAARLDPDQFVQIHRATVVNIDRVDAAIRDDHGRTLLRLTDRSETLLVSRLHAGLFRPM